MYYKKIAILCSSTKVFGAIADFLTQKGLSVRVDSEAKLAMEAWAKDRPDLVLISWNLKSASGQKVADLAVNKFGLEVLAFAEEPDTKTATSLASSSMKQILHAPVSGPVIYLRLQKLSKERGPEAPKVSEASWQPTEVARKDPKALFVDTLEKVVKGALTPIEWGEKPFITDKMLILELRGPSFTGLLAVCCERPTDNLGTRASPLKLKIQDAILTFGRGLKTARTQELSVGPFDLMEWSKACAAFSCVGRYGAETLGASLIVPSEDYQTFEAEGGFARFNLVRLEPNSPLDFDVFIHLPVNGRMFKIFKKGASASADRLERMKSSGQTQAFIKAEDREGLDKHLIQNEIFCSLKRIKTKVA